MTDFPEIEYEDDSITHLGRAVDHFVDRRSAIRRFAALVNDDLPQRDGERLPLPVQFFHGDGGNGKSLLLRFLRERCSARFEPDDWAHIRALKDDEEFVVNLTEADAPLIPCAATEFDTGAEDVLGRLRDVRIDLQRYGFRFPHFDYACIDYWRSNGYKSADEIKALFPSEELQFVSAALGFVGTLAPYGQLLANAIDLFNKHFGEQTALHRFRRGLDQELFRDMQRWNRRTELLNHLPKYFASDLNTQMRSGTRGDRVALFFDSHERFWGNVRNIVPAENPERDRWYRSLLNRLDLRSGIIVVVAGREAPPWTPRSDEVHFDLELHYVEEFTDADATNYLRAIKRDTKVIPVELFPTLLDLARVRSEPDHVHPLFLGLAADVVIAAARKRITLTPADLPTNLARTAKPRELVQRLWQYVDEESRDAVRALSACRQFTGSIYRHLGSELIFGLVGRTIPRFDRILIRPSCPQYK